MSAPDDLRSLLDAAALGPWTTFELDGSWVVGRDTDCGCEQEDCVAGFEPIEPSQANARLIAIAPELAEEVLDLRERAARADREQLVTGVAHEMLKGLCREMLAAVVRGDGAALGRVLSELAPLVREG